MTAAPLPSPGPFAHALAFLRPYLRPRPRWRELGLLALVALTLWVGGITLGTTLNLNAATLAAGEPPASLEGLIEASRPQLLSIYLGALLIAHLALVVVGRRSDQVLLPTVGLLGGLSLLLMERLPQGLAGALGGLAQTQLVWLLLGLGAMTVAAIAIRSDAWLRRYKYTWAAVGVGLLLLVFVLGREVNGQRLTLQVGPISGQPTELLKVILVIFLAGYLSENRPLLVAQSTRIGPFRLPPVPYLVPMVAMWAIALGIVIVQRDLGAALLLFAVFLLLLYVATARWGYVVLGIGAFIAGGAILYSAYSHVRTRVDIWLDPFSQAQDVGYQVVQALHAFARGGILGTGLGGGLPTVGSSLPGGIPEIHTDFPFAALGEEFGLIGVLAVLGLYLVLIERGLRIAASAPDEFRAILAAGLSLVVGVQAFIIAAGNLKLIPLTGITLPFISYGGSSILANGVIVGLLLALSDRGSDAPRAPRRRAT